MTILTYVLGIPFTAIGMITTGIISLVVYFIKSSREKSDGRKRQKKFFDSIENHYIERPSGKHNNHFYVDLGLPSGTFWATRNVGAEGADQLGNYYQWGHTTTEVNKIIHKPIYKIPTYNIPELDMPHDAARANWGGAWRMPTKEEFEELIGSCKWELAKYGHLIGYLITGPNGNSIFLPRTGYVTCKKLEFLDDSLYWTRQQVGEGIYFAHTLNITPYGEDNIVIHKHAKTDSLAVRAVCSRIEALQEISPAITQQGQKEQQEQIERVMNKNENPPKKKGGFLKGLGIGMMIMSAPLFVKALGNQDKIEAVRNLNPLRAENMQNSANFSMTLAIILLVGGIVAIVAGIIASSSREKVPEKKLNLETSGNDTVPVILSETSGKKKNNLLPIILAAVFGLGLLTLILWDSNLMSKKDSTITQLKSKVSARENKIDELEAKVEELNSSILELKEEKETLEEELNNFPPLRITDVKIGITDKDGNIVVEHGKTIYSYETMYISPLAYYTCVRSESVELKLKLFSPDGKMRYNSEISPSGFTNKTTFETIKGDHTIQLTGWGSANRGHWDSGEYRIEIWYKSMCLYSRTFRIY